MIILLGLHVIATLPFTEKKFITGYPVSLHSQDYYFADCNGLRDHLRDNPWEEIFKLGASASASKSCEWFQVGIDVYIAHRKYQAKPLSFPWFSAACAAPIVYKNHFFCLYQKDKSAQSKTKFRQTSNGYKSVLETAKLAYANKAKKSISSQKFGLRDFFTYFIHNLFIVGKYR